MTNETITATSTKPKLAFIGTGWIGLNRMKHLLSEKISETSGILDVSEENVKNALALAPGSTVYKSMEQLLESKPDGVVIATPSALHAEQAKLALEKGIPVFCQKPLARTAQESREVVAAAQKSDRLLGVDLSYRFTEGMQKIYELAKNNSFGKIFAVDLVFHNAYGPDKDWFYNPELSGGGCLIDLGIHLIDLALWVLGFPDVENVSSAVTSGGKLVDNPEKVTEDFVSAQFITAGGAVVRLTSSWNLNAGKEAEIKASFYGTSAAAIFENVNGSFYDFETRLCHGTSSETISSPPYEWGGNALADWTKRLAKNNSFNPQIKEYIRVAEIIDKIYGRNAEVEKF